jgi:hypothetical protein
MARKYKKDIKVVLPHIDPFRDIAVYGAGEEMIKALGGQLADKGKQPGIVPTSNSPYFKKYGDGGTNKTKLSKKDEPLFNEFYKTLPNNLRVDDPTYDIRGYWDSEGRPNKFNYDQPKDSDGYYHAYSINSNTGEYLKSPLHPTFRQAVEEDRKIGYRPITNMYGRNIAIENKSIADPEEESILINTKGPRNYIEKYYDGGKKKLNTSVNPTKQSPVELHQEIYKKANYTPYVPTPEELGRKASGRIEQSPVQPEDLLMLGLSAKNLFKAQSLMNNAKQPIMVQGFNLAHPRTLRRAQQALNKAKGQALAEGTTQAIDYAYGGPINNTDNMKKSNKKGQSPRSILSPEQRMAMQFGWGGALGSVLGAAAGSFIPVVGTGLGASIGGALGSAVEGSMDNKKQPNQQFQPQYQQPLPQQMSFAKGGMLNKRGIPHRGTSEQMPYQTQMQSYPNLEFGNGEQMLAMGGELEDTEFAEGGIHIKPSKRGTFTAAATKHGKSVQGFASQVLANKENYSPAMVKKANFARNAAKWKHAEGGFLNEPAEGVIERRNKNRSREPQEYATFEENFKHMYAQGGRMGAMGPMDVGNIYYADGGMLNEYNGYNHEDGGIPIGPNAEVEGGETSMKTNDGNTYIFSDRLLVPGKKITFAEDSKSINNKYGKRTNDKISEGTKKRELDKLASQNEQVRQAKEAQEQAMVQNAYQTIAAYGGPIHKYDGGGLSNPTLPFNPLPFYNVPNSIYNNAPMPNDLNFKKSFEVNPADNFKFNTGMPKNAFAKGISQMPSTPNQPAPPYINVPVSGMTSQGSSAIPNIGGGRSTVAPDGSVTDEGIRENSMAPYLGYGMQALGLGAEAWRLRGKNVPNKAFTMNKQVLNADEALSDADIAAAVANKNIQTLGANTSSGGAMAGYLAAQTSKTRSKAAIRSNLRKEQAASDMTVDQYNAMAGERAFDKNAADAAAQQSAYSKLFGNIGQLGATMAKDYGTRQSENIATAALGTADFDYKRIKGKLVKVPKGTV